MKEKCVTESELKSWIERALESENIVDYEIKLTGKTEKGDGYVGDIVFVDVEGTSKEGTNKELSLAIKHGKPSDAVRKVTPVRAAFETEIHFYKNVLPAYKKFQNERNILDGFDSAPYCYAALVTEDMEVLVLENLRSQGYELYDRTKPLDLLHQKKVLTAYGKLHALSFALKDQHPEKFEALLSSSDVMKDFFKVGGMRDSFHRSVEQAIDILNERGDSSLARKLKQLVGEDAAEAFCELLDVEESETVILHGDCWNNNFMYKYNASEGKSPSNVMILDWQISTTRSPVFDISYFIYSTSSKENLEHFDELLRHYYESFSHFLQELGSDPEVLYPFSSLQSHWRKFSLFGLLITPTILKFVLCDKEDAPDLADLADDDNVGDFFKINLKRIDLYYQRLRAVVGHYFEHNLKNDFHI